MEKNLTYEQASKKLDEIISQLENNNVSLEETTRLFEEAEKLLKICADALKTAKGKILVIKDNIATLLEEKE